MAFSHLRGWIHRWTNLVRLRVDLSYILEKADPDGELADRIEWLEQLIDWIRYSGSASNESLKEAGQLHAVRIKFILQLIERNPAWKKNLAACLRSILQETSGVALYSETGLAGEFGLGAEIFSRIGRKFLPVAPNHADLAQLFDRIFHSADDAIWTRSLPLEIQNQVIRLLFDGAPFEIARLQKRFSDDLIDALEILSAKVESLGVAPDIRRRLNHKKVMDLAFVKIHRCITDRENSENLEELFIQCAQNIQEVYKHLETLGVSIAVVYRLDILTNSLERMRILAAILGRLPSDDTLGSRFIADLIHENIRKNSVRQLIRDQFRLLAKKIVERNGVSGEHYIARDRGEWFKMFLSASGGGLVTVFTAFIKFFIIRLSFAPFFEGLFFWANYSTSFLLMQAMGFTLATKQPSATAPALAGKLKEIEREHQLEQFVDEVIRIIRSQFAAAVGNVGIVIPGSILMGLAYQFVFGHSVLTPVEAEHTIASLHPFRTLTILHASLTGVLLWFSSVSGGWFENWIVYHQIPEAIAQNRSLIQVFGKNACEKFAHKLLHNVAGIGINLVLGFTLAFTPVFFRFFGVAMEAKHVTLSSGALSFAVISMPHQLFDIDAVIFAFIGIVIVGIFNFGISFLLAMFVAQRARQVPLFWVFKLLSAVRKRFFKNPFAFFFAPVQSKILNE